jgi:hypothetical protein
LILTDKKNLKNSAKNHEKSQNFAKNANLAKNAKNLALKPDPPHHTIVKKGSQKKVQVRVRVGLVQVAWQCVLQFHCQCFAPFLQLTKHRYS